MAPDSYVVDYFRARELAVFWARIALEVARRGYPFAEPARRAHEAARFARLLIS